MRLAYIIYQGAVIGGRSNGIRSQALTWKRLLESVGHEVVLVNNWEHYNWDRFDAIHIFGYDLAIDTFLTYLIKKNPNVYISPIIDSNKSPFLYRLASLNGLRQLRLFSTNYVLKEALKKTKGVCVRSEHEKRFVNYSLGVHDKQIYHVPLSTSFDKPQAIHDLLKTKEDFCLHVSSIYQPRKNVLRLIEAAKQYNFRLILAGNKGSRKDFEPLLRSIGNSPNIEVLGFVDDTTLRSLYERAKVFALPSLIEGVGIVALDAAIYGCNIVITKIGAPKEYYLECTDNVRVINPYSIDDIGKAVLELLQIDNSDNLIQHIEQNYSKMKLIQNLEQMYFA